jgi:two-component system, LytTR family, sensor kinase
MPFLKNPAILSYVIAMVVFFSIPLVFAYGQANYSYISNLVFSPAYWLFIGYYLVLFLLLSALIIPALLMPGRYIYFVATTIALVVLTIYVKPFDRLVHRSPVAGNERPPFSNTNGPANNNRFSNPPPADRRLPPPAFNTPPPNKLSPLFDIVSVFLLLLLFLMVLAIELQKKWRATEQKVLQAEADKVNAELSFLKAQINPHFLFNTLNNIYSLAITQNDYTAEAVMKLSNIMRYVTDEVNETLVPLQSEADCINNYISLQQLRLGENVTVNFTINGLVQQKQIPPLIMMTFVENAFKHGVSNHEPSLITIKINAQANYIHFFVQNKLQPRQRVMERTGIGIENTRKRLQALYPDKHLLEITEAAAAYTVQLILYH